MASIIAMKPAPMATQAGKGVAIKIVTAKETLNGIRLRHLITRSYGSGRLICGFYDCGTQVLELECRECLKTEVRNAVYP